METLTEKEREQIEAEQWELLGGLDQDVRFYRAGYLEVTLSGEIPRELRAIVLN